MKTNILFFIILFLPLNIVAQQLNIRETLNYIEKIHSEYNTYTFNKNIYKNPSDQLVSLKYNIDNEGVLKIKHYRALYDNYVTWIVHVDDIKRDIKIFNKTSSTVIEFNCLHQNCFTAERPLDKSFKSNYNIEITQEYQAKKLFTAFNYLFSLLDEKNFNRDKGDPFASAKNLDISKANTSKSNEVKVTDNDGGTYSINVSFGNTNQTFILDSGAAETSITSTLERKLIADGLITKNDYLPDGLYKIADGSIISQRRAIIKQLKVGEFTVKNVVVSIGDDNSPFLLGRSFLDKFKEWSIDNQRKVLKLNY